jgi:hypothetical protein
VLLSLSHSTSTVSQQFDIGVSRMLCGRDARVAMTNGLALRVHIFRPEKWGRDLDVLWRSDGSVRRVGTPASWAEKMMTSGPLYFVDVAFTEATSIVLPTGYRLALTIEGRRLVRWLDANIVHASEHALPDAHHPGLFFATFTRREPALFGGTDSVATGEGYVSYLLLPRMSDNRKIHASRFAEAPSRSCISIANVLCRVQLSANSRARGDLPASRSGLQIRIDTWPESGMPGRTIRTINDAPIVRIAPR